MTDPTLHAADTLVGPRNADGLFVRATNDDAMLDGVARVAAYITEGDIDEALGVSMRQWNEAQRIVDDSRCPKTAVGVARRLDASWSRCLELAFADTANRVRLRAVWTSGEGLRFADELLIAAMQRVAHRLGHSPTTYEYDATCKDIEDEYERDYGVALPLPNLATILTRYKSWSGALDAASLPTPTPPLHTQLDPADLANLCIDEIGLEPTGAWFETWCKVRGHRLGRQRWSETITEARKRREAAGNEWPKKAPVGFPLPEALPGDVTGDRVKYRWSDSELLDALRIYVADADARKRRPTERDFAAFSRGRLDIPSLSAVNRRGPSFHELLKLARKGATALPACIDPDGEA